MIKKLIERIKKLQFDTKDMYAEYESGCVYDNDLFTNYGPKVGKKMPRFKRLAFLMSILNFCGRLGICKMIGHKMIDDSFGTPDTGYEGWHCERCGHEVGNYLY